VPESSSRLESRIDALSRRLGEVERRLAALEEPGGERTEFEGAQLEPERLVERTGFGTDLIPLSGRTLVVLGGAFLLRAVTEGGFVPQIAGTALGIAYAVLWIVFADRAAAVGKRSSATFHGLAAVAIAFPLLWEATVKFEFLAPQASAAVLALVAAAGLVVAGRRELAGLAWVVSLGTAVTALAMALPTKTWSLFVFELLLLALAVMWLGYRRQWQPMAWTLGGLISGTILLMTAISLRAGEEQVWELFSADMLLAIQLCWVVVFIGTLGYRKLTTSEDLTLGEILSGLAVLVVGFGGATAVTRTTVVSGTSLGVVSLALAAGAYGVAFAVADRSVEHRRGFIFYSSVALLVTLVASVSVMQGSGLTITFCAGALLTAWLGFRRSRATLSLHGAVYVFAAAAASGLIAATIATFVAAGTPNDTWITLSILLVLAVAAVFGWFPIAAHGRTWGRFSGVPKIAVLALLLLGIAAIGVSLAVPALPADDPALLASLRTAALAAVAVAAAWLGGLKRWPEAARLVYPLLAIGGVKLLAEDVPRGRPLTLFLSFALYGAALILAPRLARRAN
jgi:hypothetical protein